MRWQDAGAKWHRKGNGCNTRPLESADGAPLEPLRRPPRDHNVIDFLESLNRDKGATDTRMRCEHPAMTYISVAVLGSTTSRSCIAPSGSPSRRLAVSPSRPTWPTWRAALWNASRM